MATKKLTLCVAISLLCLLITGLVPLANADYLTVWTTGSPALGVIAHPYPGFVAGESCVAQASVVYCVGGLNGTALPTNSAYAASLTSSGVGQWERLSSYPTEIAGESCVADSGYIYCVGGLVKEPTRGSTSEITAASYFGPLSGVGMGNWTRTTDYPFAVFDQSCTTSSGYVYCVGGIASNSSQVSAVEYARLSASGVSKWNSATPYPSEVSASSCVSYAQGVYCVGGLNGTSRAVSSVYYTKTVGQSLDWTAVASYPDPVAGHSCIVHYPGLYCVGGLNETAYATRGVFFTYLNGNGLSWLASTFYPVEVQSQSCVTSSANIYCVGGYDGQSFLSSVYYSSIGTSPENPVSGAAESSTATVAANATRGSVSSVATYGSLVVAGGVAVVIIVASLTSRKRFQQAPASGADPPRTSKPTA